MPGSVSDFVPSPEPATKGVTFELTGGALCLDFANTVDNRPAGARELLQAYGDLGSWAEQSGVLDAASGAGLRAEAGRRPQAAESALAGARALREALYAYSRPRGRPPAAGRGRGDAERGAGAVARAPSARPRARGGVRVAMVARGRRARRAARADCGLGRGAADLVRPRARARVRGRHLRLALHRPQPQPLAPLVRHGGLRQPRKVRRHYARAKQGAS